MTVQNARSRLESIEKQLTDLSALKSTGLPNTTSQDIVSLTRGGHLECVWWEFRQPNKHSEPINKPLVDEIMDFPEIIYRNNNYVANLYATANNENKNVIFIQQFYIPKQYYNIFSILFNVIIILYILEWKGWIKVNLRRVELNWLSWIEFDGLNWIELNWNVLSCVGLDWVGLGWVESNWIEKGGIRPHFGWVDWIELELLFENSNGNKVTVIVVVRFILVGLKNLLPN